MKITLPLILKKNKSGSGQEARPQSNVYARGLLDISMGSEEDFKASVCMCHSSFMSVNKVRLGMALIDFYDVEGSSGGPI